MLNESLFKSLENEPIRAADKSYPEIFNHSLGQGFLKENDMLF
jgi:hypothetical protein